MTKTKSRKTVNEIAMSVFVDNASWIKQPHVVFSNLQRLERAGLIHYHCDERGNGTWHRGPKTDGCHA